MAELILSSLNKEGIDTSKMAFQSYDHASSMSGQFKGVQKYITEEVGHNVPYIPCQDHRANTALEHACNVIALMRQLLKVLEQLHVFFTSSKKRFSHLIEKLEDIDIAIQLVNLSRTRWIARAKSFKAFNQCLEKVIDLLQSISNNKIFDTNTRTKPMGLLKKVTTFDFIITLFFMKNIIEKIKILTEILESPNFNVIDSINVIESTAKNIQNISNDTDAMNNLIESAIIFSRKLHIDAENDYKRHHRLIAIEMKAFYGKNSKSNQIFPPGYKDHIPDVHVLKGQMEILIDICLEEGDEDFKTSRTPVKMLQDILYHVVKLKDILKQAHKLYIFVITAANGVASNERSFSQLKIVKSHLKTTMSDKRLDSLMLLKCEKELCKGVNPEHLVKQWVQLKKRHIKIKL
ncbi:uncharacterized protein LOC136088083 [Hydra vulgaris]|uniref:Uncharacterized protein LOC136088083 n=1 Tax=Hydra vulgaris TaxID=6087 RepID=A0ABM4D0P8_HYDVU